MILQRLVAVLPYRMTKETVELGEYISEMEDLTRRGVSVVQHTQFVRLLQMWIHQITRGIVLP